MSHNHKSLQEIHDDVPADHYDIGVKRNLFQKYWHYKRFSEVKNILQKVDGRILDIGCHSGLFTEHIIRYTQPKEIYGIDISSNAIQMARKRLKTGKFFIGSAEKLPFKSNYFDAVFCLEVLEHVDYPGKVIKQIHKVMKKGGYGVILVPTESRLFKFVWFLWTLYYPTWKHAHVQEFQNKRLESLIEESGCKILKSKTFNLGMLKLVKFQKV